MGSVTASQRTDRTRPSGLPGGTSRPTVSGAPAVSPTRLVRTSLPPGGASGGHGHNVSRPAPPHLSSHGVRRWFERVGADSLSDAAVALMGFLVRGKASGRAPRWAWSRGGEGLGSQYVTNPDVPGVCVVVCDGWVVTVVVRRAAAAIRVYEAAS